MSFGRIKIHTGVFILFLFALLSNRINMFVSAFIAVTIHEMAHIIAAIVFGGSVFEICITPIGEFARIKDFWKFSQFERVFILICGPLINIIIGLSIKFLEIKYLYLFSDINIAIAIFNIIPVLPLDGGNILYSIIGRKKGVIYTAKFMTAIEGVFGIILMFVGVIQVILYPFNISLIITGAYFVFSKRKEYLERVSEFYMTVIDKNRIYNIPMNVKTLYFNGDYREVIKYFNYDDYFFVIENDSFGNYKKRSMEDIVELII